MSAAILRAIEQSSSFVSLFDREGRIVWTNRLAYGIGKAIIGKPSDTLVWEEDRDRWWEAFRRVIHHREPVEYVVRIVVPEPPKFVRLVGRLGPVVQRNRVHQVLSICDDRTYREEPNPLARFVLTPMSRLVVTWLLEHGPAKGAAIGRAVGQRASSGQASQVLRYRLKALVDRGILEHGRDGYSVSLAFREVWPELR